ncbi:phosphotransferase family protein [Streptomyces sp. NPDC057428]|uniref:phosphotransferase family protein n=1 Tax=Streptomyces sp. NPDC057428 TaxID=3346129 RepID=UPI0036BF60A9
MRWTDVPAPLRGLLETALGGAVTNAVTPAGGFGHQLAAALTLADGRRFFVKASPADDPLTAANLHEGAVLGSLPAGAPAPELVGIHHAAGWTAVVIAHLDGPHPDLSPDSSDPGQIWALLDKLTSSPAPRPYIEAVASTPSGAAGLHGWDQLLADPPGDLEPAVRQRLPELAELEAAWPALAHGDRIVHGDLRADNMVHDRTDGVIFVDWAHATTGPACIDAVSLAPQLVLAGHRPQDIARLLNEHPASATSPLASTAFLAALTGHWHRNARRPAPPGAPGLRAYQHQAAAAGAALLLLRIN